MAEIAIGIVVGLLQQAIPAGISKLKARFLQAKASEGETRELEDFLRCIQDCSTKYQNTCGGSMNTTTTTSSFAKTLDDVKKTLNRWSSQNSGFISRSSGDRVEGLRSLRRTVENAINVEILGMLRDQKRILDSIYARVKKDDGHAQIRHPPSIDTQQPSKPINHPRHKDVARAKASGSQVGTRTTDKVATDRVRSKSTGRASTNHNKPPALGRSRSKSVQRDRHHSSHQGEKTRTVDLWVSVDSEKQAKDIKNKLMGLQDVKKVFYDLVTKKVSVVLGEGSKVGIATLLSEIQKAQLKDKVPPTRWLERPSFFL